MSVITSTSSRWSARDTGARPIADSRPPNSGGTSRVPTTTPPTTISTAEPSATQRRWAGVIRSERFRIGISTRWYESERQGGGHRDAEGEQGPEREVRPCLVEPEEDRPVEQVQAVGDAADAARGRLERIHATGPACSRTLTMSTTDSNEKARNPPRQSVELVRS